MALKLGMRAEDAVDLIRKRFFEPGMKGKSMKIIAFHGMGNNTSCRVLGRVLEYKRETIHDGDSLWRNLQDSYRRFETDEIPFVPVCVEVADEKHQTVTDEEGYFVIEFPSPANRLQDILLVSISLPEHLEQHEPALGAVYFPSAHAAFGVISDIDDTVLITQATSIMKMMRLTLLESTSSRMPFGGIATFFADLHAQRNPFFYVSSSPWNLFEFLDDFLQLNGIVQGPLLLRDYGIDATKLVAGPHKTHKLSQIRSVLEFYPDLCFILIGDSGQQDPEIYAQIVKEYPGRILSIYIRDVGNRGRDRSVQELARKLQAQSVDMLLVPDTLAAAHHAACKGYVANTTPDRVSKALLQEKSMQQIDS